MRIAPLKDRDAYASLEAKKQTRTLRLRTVTLEDRDAYASIEAKKQTRTLRLRTTSFEAKTNSAIPALRVVDLSGVRLVENLSCSLLFGFSILDFDIWICLEFSVWDLEFYLLP